MEKPSSSLKKKRSKKLSKAKASSRSKKSRKSKSKKVHYCEVSLSSSDYDDSKSLDTSSSCSEDSHRSKRDRSRTRRDVKGHKRKARGRSYIRDSSEDSHYARKRKKAKRKTERDEVRKKSFQKKKIKRVASVDSIASRSWSCSTCQDESANSDDNQHKNRRGRSEKRKEKDERSSTCQDESANSDDDQHKSRRGRSEKRKEKDRRRSRGRSRSKKSSRYMARSCSSCSLCSENSYEVTREKYIGENNSRWLRSEVVIVTKEAEEYGELCRNETKEEIVDDHDYPCRSNDSNDGGTKRELDHHTLASEEEKLHIENETGDMSVDLNFTEPKLRDRSFNHSSNQACSGVRTTEPTKETSETSGGANVNDDDLELILRQKALENLRKFRELQSRAKAPDDKIVSQVKQPTTDKHVLVQGKCVVNDAVEGTKFDKKTPEEETNLRVGRRNLIASRRNNEGILNMDKDISDSLKCHLACGPEKKVINTDNSSGIVAEFTESTNYNTSNLELTNAKLLTTEGVVEQNAAKTPQAAIQSINNNEADDSRAENETGKLQQDESNQSSQFEQKTMNVMRGGEMVQVSYKVYIPKKVPPLSRRQLKR